MRLFTGREQRVKVKTPKSGSDRLELVLDTNYDVDAVDDNREPDHHDYYSDPPEYEQRDGDDHYDYGGINPCASGHSASTCETNNTSSNHDTVLSRTWSTWSNASQDAARREQHGATETQVVLEDTATREHENVDIIEEGERVNVNDDADDDDKAHLDDFTSQIEEEIDPQDELLGSMSEDFDGIEEMFTMEDVGEIKEQCEQATGNDEELEEQNKVDETTKENEVTVRPTLNMNKAVSFDDSYNASFDFDVDDPAHLAVEDEDESDDDEDIGEEETLKIMPSADTSVESVGYRVTTSLSKETLSPPPMKGVLRQPKYPSNLSVSSNVSMSSQNSFGSGGGRRRASRKSARRRSSSRSSSRSQENQLPPNQVERERRAKSPSPPSSTIASSQSKNPSYAASQSVISDMSVNGSESHWSKSSDQAVQRPHMGDVIASSRSIDSEQVDTTQHQDEDDDDDEPAPPPSRNASQGRFWNLQMSPSAVSTGAQSNAALDGFTLETNRPKRQFFFSKGKKKLKQQNSESDKKTLFKQPKFLRRNSKKEDTKKESKSGKVFVLSPKSRKPQKSPREFSPRNSETNNDRGVSAVNQSSIIGSQIEAKIKKPKEVSRKQMKEKPTLKISSPRSPQNYNPWAGQEGAAPTTSPHRPRSPHNGNPWANQGNINNVSDPQSATNLFSKEADASNPPDGSYNLKGAGMPAIKWWTWSQPHEENVEKDCRYCALMCMFPPEDD